MRRTGKSLKDYEFQVFQLRWEFLRRNKNYIKDANEYFENCEGMDNPDKLAYFISEYGILYPTDPEESLSEKELKSEIKALKKECSDSRIIKAWKRIKYLKHSFLFRGAQCLTPEEHILSYDASCNPECMPLSKDEIRNQHHIKVSINLNVPTERIINDLEEIVNRWKVRRSALEGSKKARQRLDEYRRYLDIYDKYKMGWSKERLRKKFYKNYTGEKSVARMMVKRAYDKCVKLIDGGYKQIV